MAGESGMTQLPFDIEFDIEAALSAIAAGQNAYPKAGLFALAEEGYDTLFEVLIGCILSIRTRDEEMVPAARRLFALARTPADMARLTPEQIDAVIASCTFHETKARQIGEIARQIVETHGGELPCERDVLLGFAGVGPKCANLSLGIACGQPFIAVDIHVHRVCNRWGYVQTRTPEQTLTVLESKLPQRYWIEINRLVMPFGKFVCTGERPHCSTCPLLPMCPQIGVNAPR
jgi:endonuclease-3